MEVDELKVIAESYGKEIEIIGRKSEQTKRIINIINDKKPNPENFFVIEGIWLHEQAYRSSLEVDSFIVCPALIYSEEGIEIVKKFISKAKNIYVMISESSFQRFCEKDDPHGVISVCGYKKYTLDDLNLDRTNLFVILDGLETPGNIGTIIRSIDGAGGDGVILCKSEGSARMNHPKLIRASQCTCFNIPIIEEETPKIIQWLKDNEFDTFLLDPSSSSHEYHEFSYEKRVAFVAGNERYGISSEWYNHNHHKIFIPMFGQIDSLNVGIATSIVLYEASLKQKGHMKR